MITPVIDLLSVFDLNVIQMQCPEATFINFETGLHREPKGFKEYDKPEFQKHCDMWARLVGAQAQAFVKNGYRIVIVLGIEGSPSCAVEHQYSRRGPIDKPGIFMSRLRTTLLGVGISPEFVGLNRRAIDKSLLELKTVLAKFASSDNLLAMFRSEPC